jgi:hypothetical protein
MTVNDELRVVLQQSVVAYFKGLNEPGGTK